GFWQYVHGVFHRDRADSLQPAPNLHPEIIRFRGNLMNQQQPSAVARFVHYFTFGSPTILLQALMIQMNHHVAEMLVRRSRWCGAATRKGSNVMRYFWPELEFNYTWFTLGENTGKNQLFITPGLIIGRIPIHGRVGLTFGAGYQVAVTHHPAYNNAVVA